MQMHPKITVADVRAGARLYEEVPGLKAVHGGDAYGQPAQGGQLLLQRHNREAYMNHPPLAQAGERLCGGVLLWFKAEDFEGQVRRLREHGITPLAGPCLNEYAAHREVRFCDPDGCRVVVAGPSQYDKRRE